MGALEPPIPFENWEPISVADVVALFREAPFAWCLAGGYAIEHFVGKPLREHGDIDMLVFRDEQLAVQTWLNNWQLYAADPPGSLRKWQQGEYLERGIHDIWGHQAAASAWQMQLMLMEVDGDRWFNRRNPAIGGLRDDLIVLYNEIPCLRVEVQLLYKAQNPRPKDHQDFQACVDLMSDDARHWLCEKLRFQYPDGHEWLEAACYTSTL